MLEQGLIIMTVGMGTVFMFLVIMVIAMHITHFVIKNVVNRLFPEVVPEVVSPAKGTDDAEVAVAIAATKLLKL